MSCNIAGNPQLQAGERRKQGQASANSQTCKGTKPEAVALVLVNAEHPFGLFCLPVTYFFFCQRHEKSAEIPDGKMRSAEASTLCLACGSGPFPAARAQGEIRAVLRAGGTDPQISHPPSFGGHAWNCKSAFPSSCDPRGCLRATARTSVEVLVSCELLFLSSRQLISLPGGCCSSIRVH